MLHGGGTGRLVGDKKVHPPPSVARRTAGMTASFVASGLIHEVMFWYAEGRLPGRWLIFFSVQVLCAGARALPHSSGCAVGQRYVGSQADYAQLPCYTQPPSSLLHDSL